MTTLTPALLAQIMQGDAARAAECFDNMVLGMRKFNITTPARISCFLAQVKWESGGLRYFAELASGDAYEGRADLGNTQPGDGRRYKGSGPLQLTGRDNFEAANRALHAMGINIDIVSNPDLARTVQYGFLASCWWWGHDQFSPPNTNCNLVADNMGNVACGRAVNRGNPYSGSPAQDEQARIDAYQHVLTFGDLSLPGSTPQRPTPPRPQPASTAPPFPLPSGWFGPGGILCDDRLRAWQQKVGGLTPDGVYGPQTRDKVGALQRFRGLTVDYRIGPQTWAAAWTPAK